MKKKVLVADDSITIQKIVAMAFENEDAEVEGIGDGKKAFARLAKFKPDIVLADIDMPGYTGFELSKKIKESAKFKSIRVLLLASDFEDFNDEQFQASKADDYISKPFKSDDIIKKARELFGESKQGGAEPIALSEADMVDTTEQKADAAFELSAEDLIEGTPDKQDAGGIILSESDLVSEPEPSPVMELSSDDLVEESSTEDKSLDDMLDDMVKLTMGEEDISAATPGLGITESSDTDQMIDAMIQEPGPVEEIIEELAAPVEPEPVPETVQASEPEPEPKPEPLDDMISHVESIKEKKQPGSAPLPVQPSGQPDFDEFIGDTMLVAEEHTEELDDAFQEVAGRGKIPAARKSGNKKEVSEEVSPFDSIVPEPEDLLEKMAPSAFSRGKGSARPDLIGDSLTFLSEGSIESRRPTIKTTEQVSRTPVYKQSLDSGEERFVQVVGEHVKRLLEKSLATSLEKEISGLSEMIAQSVKKVVKEIAPGIAREIIKQEVDKIKNM